MKKVLILLALPLFICLSGKSQSKAHELSKYAILDPVYNSESMMPVSSQLEGSIPWIYGESELESWRLQLLISRVDSAKLKVRYPGVYHKPYKSVTFHLALQEEVTIREIRFKATGTAEVFVNGILVRSFPENSVFQFLDLGNETRVGTISFMIKSETDLPALLVEDSAISTSNKAWKWKSGETPWGLVSYFPQNKSGIAPHMIEDEEVVVKPQLIKNGLIDFGRELFGYVEIRSEEMPKMVSGESETEALDVQNTVLEQTLELVQFKPGIWRSKAPLAFRYVNTNARVEDVSCSALFYPSKYAGAFSCSDSLLTQIWMNSAYTLKLCMHDFLLDGIKRDRLPWTGDLAMSMLVNSYTFGDKEMVRKTLTALGRAGIREKDINGILDYSLWWLIAQDQYQLYYADKEHLEKEWQRIKDVLEVLSTRSDQNGFLSYTKDDWTFIDWVNQEKWTAIQVLWWWAQRSAVQLAERMNDTKTADYWKEKSQMLETELKNAAWDSEKMLWTSSRNSKDLTRHPNFLAVVSGLTSSKEAVGIRDLLENPEIPMVGTPYMAGFEMIARTRLGNIDYTLSKIKEYWGGMISRGATSFWEAYDPRKSDSEQYSFYRRPYANSLCHAWSSGPAAILPSQILGLLPMADGWKEFSIEPNLGSLKYLHVSVPSQSGDIRIDVENGSMTVDIPNGTTLNFKGNKIKGPFVLVEKI